MSMTGCVAGNIVIAHALIDGAETAVFSVYTNIEDLAGTDNAMTNIVNDSGATVARMWFTIGRVIANGTCTVNFLSAGGSDVYARLYEFTGVNTGTTIGSVVEHAALAFPTDSINISGSGTSTTIADRIVTTNGADRLAINLIGVDDDQQASFDTEAFTGQTGGTWVCGGSYGTSTGTDGAVGLQYATMASAGTIDGGTLSIAVSSVWRVSGFALIPVAAAAPTSFPFPSQAGATLARL